MFENRKLQGWLLTSVIAILVIVALKVRVGLTPQSAPLDGRHARAEAAASEIEQSPGALDERVGRDPFAAEVCPEREIAEAGAHTPPGASDGTLRIRCLDASDGRPIEGVSFHVRGPRIPARDLAWSTHLTTDKNGEALVDCPPAWYEVTSPVWIGAQSEVRSGESTEHDVRLREAVRVSGRVVDGDGIPIHGANVWRRMAPSLLDLDTPPTAVTDA